MSFKAGDMVEYTKDPLLFGRMLVVEVKQDIEISNTSPRVRTSQQGVHKNKGVKWVACLVNPDAWYRRTERFYPGELVLSPELEVAEAA